MAIKIITDSTCDLSREFLKQNNIEVIPLKYYFGETEYSDGISMTSSEFYQKLETSDVLPTTSQVNPDEFVEIFEKFPNDTILGLFLSSELSGTFQSAVIAKGIIGSENIHLIDTRTATFGFAGIVIEAIKLRDTGVSIDDMITKLEALVQKNNLFAVVNTLKYLQKGGRLSKTSAAVGSLLNMKPIITLEDGKVASTAKARGINGAFEKLVEVIKKDEIDYNYPILIAHSNSPQNALKFKEYICEQGIDTENVILTELGIVIGVHIGPGAVGISYISK